MKNNMISKAIALVVTGMLCCCVAFPTYAGPHGGPGPRHHHHHHRGGPGWVIGAGIIGAAVLGSAIADAVRPAPPPPPPPVVVNPAPVVVAPAPVVVEQAPVATGHYEDRVQQVWVEGRWVNSVDAYGRVCRVWQQGHYENRTVRVWVPAP